MKQPSEIIKETQTLECGNDRVSTQGDNINLGTKDGKLPSKDFVLATLKGIAEDTPMFALDLSKNTKEFNDLVKDVIHENKLDNIFLKEVKKEKEKEDEKEEDKEKRKKSPEKVNNSLKSKEDKDTKEDENIVDADYEISDLPETETSKGNEDINPQLLL